MKGISPGGSCEPVSVWAFLCPQPWEGLTELVHLLPLGKAWSWALSYVKAGTYVGGKTLETEKVPGRRHTQGR